MAEKLITLGKRGGLHARRQAYGSCVTTRWWPSCSARWPTLPGPPRRLYRVLKAGIRYGDAASMAVIELVDRDPAAKGLDSGPPPGDPGRRGRRPGVSLSMPRDRPGASLYAAFSSVVNASRWRTVALDENRSI